ncbi:MAG: NIPSNAP family protein [Betaproteobacteria bacterium]|nr:MAG: NIPSNAP family protein [Betaproteobacteria bacterium]
MIDELRVYKLFPGKAEEYLNLSQSIAIPFRKDDYGKLLGFWSVASGTLSSVMNLWQHEDLATRERLRDKLQAAEAWRGYTERTHPLNQHQTVRLLSAVLPLSVPATSGNTYEIRFIAAHTGKAGAVARLLRDAAPAGPNAATIAIWTNLFGPINEVVCLCAHGDFQQSLKGKWSDEWAAFLRAHGSMIDQIESQVLLPIASSPLK